MYVFDRGLNLFCCISFKFNVNILCGIGLLDGIVMIFFLVNDLLELSWIFCYFLLKCRVVVIIYRIVEWIFLYMIYRR